MTWWIWWLIGAATGGVGVIVVVLVWLARELNDMDRRLGMPKTTRTTCRSER